jgi:hypothetical protein
MSGSRCAFAGDALALSRGAPVRVSFGLNGPRSGWVHLYGVGEIRANETLVCSSWTHLSERSARKRTLPGPASMSVIMIRVSITGYSPVCSETDLANVMWNGAANARDFWGDMSYGRLMFLNDLDQDGQDDVASVELSEAPEACEDVWPAVQAKLASLQLSRWERHVLMLPSDYAACGWAQATIGCDVIGGCTLLLTACTDYPDSLTHELGHTLGLRHGAAEGSNGVDDYEDRSTIMGYSYPNSPHRGLNSVHRLAIGMREGNTLTVASGYSGSLRLFALHAVDSDAAPLSKVALVSVGVGAFSRQYYLSFRSDIANSYESDLAKDLGGLLGPTYDRVLQVRPNLLSQVFF